MGCLCVLAKGCTFDAIDELSDVSYQANHYFFGRFIRWFNSQYKNEYIKFPSTIEEIRHVQGFYRALGIPGCLGSRDCVHVGWDMCPAGLRSDCEGKEGYLTLAFEAVVSHTRYIMGVTPAFYGTWNDKIISKFDKNLQRLRNEERYTSFFWSYRDQEGIHCHERGLFFICYGGYNKWKILMPPFKNQIDGTDAQLRSKHVESLRKDVECTFGILKKRFAIMKNKFWLHHKEQISDIFTTCCILHNMLHEWDGYDNWEEVEEEALRFDDECQAEVGDTLTMRDRSDTTYAHGDNDVEVDVDFDIRRQHLIDHFMYLRSQRYNVNRIC